MDLEKLEKYINDNLKGKKVYIFVKKDEFSMQKYVSSKLIIDYSTIVSCSIEEAEEKKFLYVKITNGVTEQPFCIKEELDDDSIKFVLY